MPTSDEVKMSHSMLTHAVRMSTPAHSSRYNPIEPRTRVPKLTPEVLFREYRDSVGEIGKLRIYVSAPHLAELVKTNGHAKVNDLGEIIENSNGHKSKGALQLEALIRARDVILTDHQYCILDRNASVRMQDAELRKRKIPAIFNVDNIRYRLFRNIETSELHYFESAKEIPAGYRRVTL